MTQPVLQLGTRLLVAIASPKRMMFLEGTLSRILHEHWLLEVNPSDRHLLDPLPKAGSIAFLSLPHGEEARYLAPAELCGTDAPWLTLKIPVLPENPVSRHDLRIPVSLPIELALEDGLFQQHQLLNLSGGGALVTGTIGLPETLCYLRLSLPDGGMELMARIHRHQGENTALRLLADVTWQTDRLCSNLDRLSHLHFGQVLVQPASRASTEQEQVADVEKILEVLQEHPDLEKVLTTAVPRRLSPRSRKLSGG